MMVRGQQMPTFRIIVKLGRGWGTVQAGLDRDSAEILLNRLLQNERDKQANHIAFRTGGYRR